MKDKKMRNLVSRHDRQTKNQRKRPQPVSSGVTPLQADRRLCPTAEFCVVLTHKTTPLHHFAVLCCFLIEEAWEIPSIAGNTARIQLLVLLAVIRRSSLLLFTPSNILVIGLYPGCLAVGFFGFFVFLSEENKVFRAFVGRWPHCP